MAQPPRGSVDPLAGTEAGAFMPYENWGGEDWQADWDGGANLLKALGVMTASIQAVMELGVDLAKDGHPENPEGRDPELYGSPPEFTSRTRQTIDHIRVLVPAHIDWGPEPIHVWGRWGVATDAAYQDPDEWRETRGFHNPETGEMQDVTMESRAMFLEFGTGLRVGGHPSDMAPRPFLYPAWDLSKGMLGSEVALYRALMT